ncbi:hypothetical protein D3C80_1622240 [compost metagenome]
MFGFPPSLISVKLFFHLYQRASNLTQRSIDFRSNPLNRRSCIPCGDVDYQGRHVTVTTDAHIDTRGRGIEEHPGISIGRHWVPEGNGAG